MEPHFLLPIFDTIRVFSIFFRNRTNLVAGLRAVLSRSNPLNRCQPCLWPTRATLRAVRS